MAVATRSQGIAQVLDISTCYQQSSSPTQSASLSPATETLLKQWQIPGTTHSASYVSMPKPSQSQRHPFKIRRATVEDAESIAELGGSTFSETFGFSLPPKDLQAYLDSAYTPEHISTNVRDPKTLVIVACSEASGEILGFAQLTRDTSEPCTAHLVRAVELQRLYTKIGYQGGGIGKALTECVETTARQLGFRNMWLGVWEGNFRAQKCYEAMGYDKIGDHEFQMGSCIQMDWIMNKEL